MQFPVLASFVLAIATVPAQAGWSLLYPTVAPPPRIEQMLAVHESLGKAILLWGYEGGQPATTAWVLTGNTWTPEPGPLPPHRYGAAIAFDAARDELVVFGGMGSSFPFDDTWRWNGTQWTQALATPRPSARFHAAAAFDRARGVVVLFGGLGDGSPFPALADTWEWDGVAWLQCSSAQQPSPRHLATMAFDPVGGGVLLYGGVGPGPGGGTLFADTWRWDGTSWTQQQPATPPPGRFGPAMTTDLHRQRIVLFGGNGGDAFTWEWDGSEWHVTFQPTPGSRFDHAMGYDAVLRRVLVHGGRMYFAGANYFLYDTWAYRTPLPADVVPFGSGCAGSAGTPTLAAAPFTLPWLGQAMRTVVQTIPAGEPGAVFVSTFGSTAPVSLGAIGMPGCDLLVPIDVAEFRLALAGTAEWSVTIPNAPALAGASFGQQAFVFDLAANPLGLANSNAITATLGVR